MENRRETVGIPFHGGWFSVFCSQEIFAIQSP